MAIPKRIQFGLAQLGPKANKKAALSLILEAKDLPGEGWKRIDQRAWRAGILGAPTPWSERARASHNLVSFRSFEQVGASRWLFFQVNPLVSHEDAMAALANHDLGSGLRNLRSEVTIVDSYPIEGLSVPGFEAVRELDQNTTGPRGASKARSFYGVVGNTFILAAFSCLGDRWSWDEVHSIAQTQALRLKG